MADLRTDFRTDLQSLRVLDLINTSESAKELLLDRALYLADRFGVEPHIACSDGPYVELIRSRGVTVHLLDTPRTMKPFALATGYAALLRLLRRHEFDILHSHGSTLGLLTRLAGPFTRARIVHTVHGFHFHEGMRKSQRSTYEWVERALLRITDVTLSQNEEDFRIIRRWNPRARSELIGNGIQLPMQETSYTARCKPRYTLSCIARFEEVKNHRMLIDAMRCVRNAGVEVRLICFGKGETQASMVAYARELDLENRIDFPGYVDNVLEHLEGVDLNVLTSIKEGVPRALIESMALGIPSLCTDVKGSREVVVDGVTGRLVPAGDVEEFARAVVGLLEDPETRQAMSEACVRRAREHYDEDRICDRLHDLYTDLCPAR
ncbi:MAG: glycosyltransferase family 4 protein [Gemmatimonadetes bacterium]|nr:glycosyltransferase family 4 protein [Gemmatimonadota bacterium]